MSLYDVRKIVISCTAVTQEFDSNFLTVIIPPWTGISVSWAQLSIVGPCVGHGERGVSVESAGQCGSDVDPWQSGQRVGRQQK